MVIISDYSDTYVKVNEDDSNILLLKKEGLKVSGTAGKLVISNSEVTKSYEFLKVIIDPKVATLDEMVVVIRKYIDNE